MTLADDLERLADDLEAHGFRSLDIYTIRLIIAHHRRKELRHARTQT